ncbi:homeobox KN domain-containing protein [Trichoderma evansii]
MTVTPTVTRGDNFFHGDWEAFQSTDDFLSRSDSKSFKLPPIRQMFPEIDLPYPDASEMSQTNGRGSIAPLLIPDYVISPTTKRRRIQDGVEEESLRSSHIPRIYRGPRHRVAPSPRLSPSRRDSERWNTPASVSPVTTMGIPTPVEVQVPSPAPRVALPNVTLPSLKSAVNYDNEVPSRPHELSRAYSHDYTMYHSQNHYQSSQPSSPNRSFDRTPFSSSVYSMPHYHDAAHFGDLGSATAGADTKQRKRRGNLPKETTDKLRAWFAAHLSHPYPTEDEKQDLMRQTGLQMNQISNWFINARRRQLPAMIHQQRESDAINGRRAVSSRERDSATSPAASDGDSTLSDEGIEMLRHRQLGSMKRGSV